jgi:hypothetical protein
MVGEPVRFWFREADGGERQERVYSVEKLRFHAKAIF